MKKWPLRESRSFVGRWKQKFACALRGLAVGVRGQSSFYAHFSAAMAVVAMATWLQVSQAEWLTLILCITMVFSAEFFNSAIEHLARAITREENPEIRDALDIASGAVSVVAFGAAIVGLLVFGSRAVEMLVS
ncbi:MAG: diacylglycerol kinase family protein [Planctomycetes bacterium]|nr:diacylglycerol kinase family protein [Planctomycetota bacterium]